MNKYLFILLYSLASLVATSQISPFSFRNININDGLSQSSVVDIAVDKTGFLWFATQDGLNRYDGKKFHVFPKNFDDVTTSSGNRLGKIVPGNKNELWLITTGGKLEKLNTYDHRFQKLEKITADSLFLPAVSSVLVSNNQLWIGTVSEGLFVWDQDSDRITRYTSGPGSPLILGDNHIHSIYKDRNNLYWVLTKNGVTILDPGKSGARKILHHTGSATSAISFGAIDTDEYNSIWLGSFGNGLFVKKEKDSIPVHFKGFSATQTIPSDLIIESVMADHSDQLWVGTYGKGVYVINTKDSTIRHLLADKRQPFSLGYNDVLCIRQDHGGGIWIGTDGGGISYWHKALTNFATYSSLNLPADISIEQVRSVVTDKNNMIWAGTSSQGIVFIDPLHNIAEQLHFPTFRKDADNPGRIVSLLCDKEGDIWVGTQGNGLAIIDAQTKKIKKWLHPAASGSLVFPDHTIWCLFEDYMGRVWAGTQNAGLCLIDKRSGIIKKIPANPAFPDNNVRAIAKMNDSILCIGYERKGIQFLHVNTGQLSPLPHDARGKIWPDQATLKCIYLRPPYLLTGTQGQGLVVYNLSSGNVDIITESRGLPNNTIYGILEDKQGHLWMSSNNGLCRFTLPANPSEINRSHFTLFSVEDGLQSNEFNTGAYYAAGNGTLFFGGIKGLTFFNPVSFTNPLQKTPVVITQATINNEVFQGDTIISYKKTLRLNHYQNSVSFDFAALNFLARTGINYNYRLSGYDDNWINAGNRNYAAYTNLSPGHYIFEVMALHQGTDTKNPVTRLFINIIPPFWQTWWFITLFLLAVAVLLYAFYRYRVNQLLNLQRVRTRIATDLHDDIGSTLTNINILSELSRKNIDNKPEAEKFLDRITEEVNASGQALDDIVWSINQDNDTIEQTVARMRRYAAEVFESTQTHYTLQSDEQIAQHRLNMELRRDYFLLFKESINNVHKHARAKNVEIRVWREKNRLFLMVRDDGAGFNVKEPTHRNGIKNMYTRAGRWNGVVDIQSEPGKGTITRISLEIS